MRPLSNYSARKQKDLMHLKHWKGFEWLLHAWMTMIKEMNIGAMCQEDLMHVHHYNHCHCFAFLRALYLAACLAE